MYGQEEKTSEKIRKQYMRDVDALVRFIPWFEKTQGKSVSHFYDGNGEYKLIQIPVFDSNLLDFVKTAGKTALVDRNYPYVYTRYRIKTAEDELKAVEKAHLKDIDVLKGVLSKYVLGGRSKASMWREAVDNGVFYAVLKKLKYLFHSTNVE
ncbi:MAG TPA: hypothetical protein DCL38_05360 [Lachnospiraceae bacterium]|nr:hypothetical protein [Lachnospiraceae bacterium]